MPGVIWLIIALAYGSAVAPPDSEDRPSRLRKLRDCLRVTSTDYESADASNHELIGADTLKLDERLAHRP